LKLKYPKGEVGRSMFYREEIYLIDGNYFVVAEGGKKILKFDSTGKFLDSLVEVVKDRENLIKF
jgi:hypothetical protein